MTNEELLNLWNKTTKRVAELELQYRSGLGLTRRDCLELRACVKRQGVVARELWIQAGKPTDPEFDLMWNPPPEAPFPWAKTEETVH